MDSQIVPHNSPKYNMKNNAAPSQLPVDTKYPVKINDVNLIKKPIQLFITSNFIFII